jgi:glucan phosphoethanolaminetransferase (alkaline phosphatase superfamily)
MALRGRPAVVESALLDAAMIVTAWAAMVLVEAFVVSLAWGQEFSAAWEIVLPRRIVAVLAVAGLAPVSVVMVGWWRVACLARDGSRVASAAVGVLGAVALGTLALGVSTGRHFASWGARGPFVAVLVASGAAAGVLVAPRVAALSRRPVRLFVAGVAVLVSAWLADAFVLPRLYPAFHLAMFVTTLLGGAMSALAFRAAASGQSSRMARGLGALVGAAVVACAIRSPHAARELQRFSNLRIILVEHAPILGRTVEATEAIQSSSGAEQEMSAPSAATLGPTEVTRSLDWMGHDIVLVTVDALRADHVSAYGYARVTTPSLDALAQDGTLFDAAYCPTPHTSYSITSMMTGKYLRPLLALGLGEESETWAQDLRRYGWRTAAFYPPAVFFIDEDRFPHFEESHLGFEYAKVEFADPALREAQVRGYLEGAPSSSPLFLWVHFFEPHEPYVAHAEHAFTGGRSADEDAYDGEVAAADDGIGRIVRVVRARRPGAVVIVTADHGEEFGEHGGRYHGTTVYEEQVRVPMVIVGPGVRKGARVATVVQTIDLLPTALSALGIPRPARLRGRDLGPVLAGESAAIDGGFAFAETDRYALVASGPDRLVCDRRAAACALYRPADDPLERRDRSARDGERFEKLRGMLRSAERDHGRYEGGGGAAWPEALRRGMQGDAEVAADVAALLDDANVVIRRKAAEVSFSLHVPSTAPQLQRALARDEDDTVRRWSALAVARVSADVPPLVDMLLKDALPEWRRRAAIVLGEHGDARGCEEMASFWTDVVPAPGQGSTDGEPPRLSIDLRAVEELLGATTRAHCRAALPALLRALEDVRARPYVTDALGVLGDERARIPLRTLLASEPYVTTRSHEARALLALGAREWSSPDAPPEMHASLEAPRGPLRVVALLSDASAVLRGDVDGTRLAEAPHSEGEVRWLEGGTATGPHVRVDLSVSTGGLLGLWLVGGSSRPTGRLD